MPPSIRPPRLLAALTLAAVASLAPRVALAQPRPSDGAAAQALFDDARALTRAGKFAEACPKFEESERLDAGPGTEFNLADCYEHTGRIASAWALFTAVADSLHALGQRDRERFSRDRARALEPKLSKLAVAVSAAARVPGLEVKRDGETLGDAQWGSNVPLDPGKHVITATAPGKQPWQQTVEVAPNGSIAAVDVPLLRAVEISPAPTGATTPPPAPVTSTPAAPEAAPPAGGLGGQKIAALVAGGVGVVALGVGGYFGAEAISKHSEYVPLCPNGQCVSPQAVQVHDTASSDATIATVTMTVGAVAVIGGVLLWLTAPSSKGTTQREGVIVVPTMSARGGGFALQGDW